MLAFDEAWALVKAYEEDNYEQAEYEQNPQWPHKNWMDSPEWPQLCDFVIEGLDYNGCGREIDGEEITGLPMMSGGAMCHQCLSDIDPISRAFREGRAKMTFESAPKLDDEKWQDSIETGEPMEKALQLLKEDTGMWDEIYAPLYEQLGGRGSMRMENDSKPPLDFIPTSVAMDMMNAHVRRKRWDEPDVTLMEAIRADAGDDGFGVNRLKRLIMEEGFKIPKKTLESSRHSVPNFLFDQEGNIAQEEGRHRTLALNELGAPYIPSFGRGTWTAQGDRAPWKMNPVFSRTDEKGYTPSDYSAAAYYGPDKGRYSTPPSWIFNQELIPGMGRLVPTHEGQPISDQEMTTHIMHTPNRRMDDWVRRPEWAVVHDD